MVRPNADDLATAMGKSWWLLLLRGLVAIAFALLTWLQPAASLAAMVLVFGIYVLADGVLGIWAALSGRKNHRHWWVLLLWGLVSVAVGAMTFLAPAITGLVLLMYIAAWAIVTGVLQIVAAFRLRKEIQGEWLMGLMGVLSVAFGLLLVAQPGAGALAVAWIIATYAFIFGALTVMMAFKVRKFANHFG